MKVLLICGWALAGLSALLIQLASKSAVHEILSGVYALISGLLFVGWAIVRAIDRQSSALDRLLVAAEKTERRIHLEADKARRDVPPPPPPQSYTHRKSDT